MHRSAAPPFRFRSRIARHAGSLLGAAWVLLAGCLAPGLASAAPGSPPPSSSAAPRGPRFVDGEVLLVFQPDARPEEVRSILRDLGAERVRTSRKSRVERHRIRKPVQDAVAKYRGHRAVRIIEPNYVIHADLVPNDPSFPIQWGLHNTGQQGGTPRADIDAVAAWDKTTGSQQVIVAIVDTGADVTHPDLAPNLYTNPDEIPGNGLDDDGNGHADDVHGFDFVEFDGDPDDGNGHGTHVAGTIGAQGSNGIGVAGVAWHVRLLPLKFMDTSGTGTTAAAIDCVDYAVLAGASVINASWGSSDQSEALELAIAGANEAGVLFVAAAGNSGVSNDKFAHYPSGFSLPNIISVGSTSRTDTRSAFSNFGLTTVDLFAPGTDILSTRPAGQYGLMSGTSMAAPHVAGALALLKSRFPGMAAPMMKTIALATTDRIPALFNLAVTGGRLNAARMLEGPDSIPPDPVADLASGAVSSDRISVVWTAPGDDGSSGTATEYDVRYSLTPLDAAGFASAPRVSGMPAPRPAGSREEAVIRGLAPLTDYYVALVVRDEFGNASPLSNVISIRTSAPPIASVDPLTIETTLQTGGRQAIGLDVRNDGAGFLDFTAAALGSAGGPVPWLSVAPGAGSASAGGEIPLSVSLSASGLTGGDYSGLVRFATNDPARRAFDVPVTMHVISAPDIQMFPTPFSFGPIPIGITDTQFISVTNTGFAVLHVTSVVVEGADFSADETPFDLPPGQGWDILISVTPSDAGSRFGSLVITSDDPDQGTIRIPLSASGIVPATIGITPSRQDAALHTGQTATRSFTISNSGGSQLSWSLRVRSAALLAFDSTGALVPPSSVTAAAPPALEPAAPPGTGALGSAGESSQAADISDVRVVFDARHGAGSGAWSLFIGSLTSRGAVFTLNTEHLTEGVLAGADVYWVSDDAGAFAEDERAALAAWVRRGGSLLIEGALQPALPEFDALLEAVGVPLRYVPDLGITGPTSRIYPFEITRDVAAAEMPSSTARLEALGAGATVLIEDAQGFPTMAAGFVERGRVLVVAGRLFADVSAIYQDNQRIASQSLDWLGGAAWLTVSPASASIAPGQSSAVTVAFDAAQTAGGEYRAALVVRSNDPDTGEFLVPVDLSVSPAPDAEAAPEALDLGSVFVGATKSGEVRVRNVGVLPLALGAASMDHPDFTAPTSPLSLAPGAVSTVTVVYAPTSLGPASATLVFGTDDPDEPEIRIPIAGSGAEAPDIDVVSEPVAAALPTGGTAARTITVANRVGNDLQYSIRFEEDAPSSSALAGPEGSASRAAAFPRTWAEARASALEMTARAVSDGGGLAAASLDSLPLVVVDPRGDGGVVDLLTVGAWALGGVLSIEIETGTDIAATNFGGYVSFDVDQNPNTGREPSFGTPRQDVGVEFEASLFSIGHGVVDVVDARTGNYVRSFPAEVGARTIRFAIPLSWLQNDDGRINMTGVIGNFVGATDWFPDHGHATIGGLWLSAEPHFGTIAAGTEVPVSLTLDALALPAGAYHGSVIVESNDPDEPVLVVPASLEVTDAATAVATQTRVHLGTVFLGRSSESEVIVGNEGRAPLAVSSVSVDSPDFTASPSSFVLLPGATQPIRLTFQPTAAGARAGDLTIAHDAGSPMTIALTGTGLVAPTVQVAPVSLESALPLGGQGSASISIRNPGGSFLDYGVEPLTGAPAVTPHAGLLLGRDEEDPRGGIAPAGALAFGGPDAFGYRWVDSNHPGGPVFDWQDIAAIGTPVPIRNLDQNSGQLPIGFTFPFYGREFTTFNVCTHGWLSFTDTTVHFANQPLPTLDAPSNLLAVFWDDLNFAGVERATYHNDGTRLIVQFTNVTRRQRGGPFTFQAILYPSGAIVYQYLLMGPPTTSGTIGIQNRNKTDGLNVVFNADYLHDRMAIRFSAAPGWLEVPERFGGVAAGDSANLGVALDARGLFAGDYHGELLIRTNDPERREVTVPVLLRANGIPQLTLSPQALRFDTLAVGESAVDTLRLTNGGTDRLEAAFSFGRPDFSATPSSVSLAPLQSAPVLVRFAPVGAGDRSTSLAIASNDPALPVASVPVTAAARLSVRALDAALVPGVIRRGSKGRDVRARVLMPSDLDAGAVLLDGILLQGIVPVDLAATRLRDLDGDGRPDLDLAFSRSAVEAALPDGPDVAVVITGEVRDVVRFEARGSVRVMGTKLAAPGVEFDADEVPAVSAMRASAPNPFSAGTAFRFDLAGGGRASLRVYTAGGRLVRTLFLAALPAGRFRAAWDGRDDRGIEAPSGVYFARLDIAGPEPFQGVCRLVRVR